MTSYLAWLGTGECNTGTTVAVGAQILIVVSWIALTVLGARHMDSPKAKDSNRAVAAIVWIVISTVCAYGYYLFGLMAACR